MKGGEVPCPDLTPYHSILAATEPIQSVGSVIKITGTVLESRGPGVRIGCMCRIETGEGKPGIAAEVIGFSQNRVLLMPLENIRGISPGNKVIAGEQDAGVDVGGNLPGRILDGQGKPIDGKGPISMEDRYPVYSPAVNPLSRKRIAHPLDTGIRAIDGLLTIGCG
ncbi:MAG: hypothetical protein V2I97_07385, partial [Desulfococcaceae bacterium]|nr:hypothetical protein [Desulfococcaceae bacterium]